MSGVDAGRLREEVERLRAYDDEVREVLYSGLDRDRDQSTTRTLAIVATNSLAREREARQSAEAALLAKSAAYDDLRARVDAAPVVCAGKWIFNYMATANRIQYGTRVRLLLDAHPSDNAGGV